MWLHGKQWWQTRHRIEQVAIAVWSIALIVILIRVAILPVGARSLFGVYRIAGANWIEGADLYPQQPQNAGYPLYRYSPIAAAFFSPFCILGPKTGDIVWRLILDGVLLAALVQMARCLAPQRLNGSQLGAFFLLMFPLTLGVLSNGQCSVLVIALILLGFSAVVQRRWNVSAGCLSFACMLKIYPISSALLLVLIHPRKLGPRFMVALAIALCAPFLFQDFDYVWRQYRLWFNYMAIEDRSSWNVTDTNLDFQLLCRIWWRQISLETYRIMEVGAAAFFGCIILLMNWAGRSEVRLLTMSLALSCVWMTVFGPATESPTYVLLAPCITWSILNSQRQNVGTPAVYLLRSSYLLISTAPVSSWFVFLISAYRARGPQPLAGLIFLGGLLVGEWCWRSDPLREISSAESPLSRAA